MADGRSDAPEIVLRGVEKSFGAHRVLCGVDLTVWPGQVLGLLGRNGAGKSTLISIMCGLERADAGTVSICGCDPARRRVGDLVGLAPQDIGVYPQLSMAQNLVCLGAVEGLSRREARNRASEVMGLLGLTSQARQRARDLSGGQRRRLHTGIALMHRPRVIFLDEPTVGTDVEARRGVLDAVRVVAATGAAVVYTTHYLGELEELGADIAVLNGGRVVAAGKLNEVVDAHARPTVRVRFAGGADPGVPGWTSAADGYFEPAVPPTDPGSAVAALLSQTASRGLVLDDVRVVHANLESAYLAIVGEEVTPHAA
ncbi:ABC transporter ATP-binding protein [Collinsella sp. An2]|uniref:ABC transporter ATP-binding protein n=1 Tax=Collinsella sp. An2 TaxID=1965585 RepID=UPI000B36F7B3|nr:ABC transporter ATP-binding protein [Collinsella sp. An2]OUP08418.1 ABC transporter [Collinsella sp. An2]